jgi:CheY-like chemotaxis protein
VLRFTRAKPPEIRPLEARSFLEGLRPQIQSVLPSTVELRIEAEPQLMLLGDSEQLCQAVTNLVTNARDAMPQGGTLTIEASRTLPSSAPVDASHAMAVISVRDTGLGIAEDVKTKMFEPLFTTKKSSGGTGLGLNVVHQIARAHGGTVFAESEAGDGSVFHLLIPISDALPAVKEKAEAKVPVRDVLIVEDDPGVASALLELARTMGLRVVHYATAAAAIEHFDGRSEVALLDIGLPDLDGTQLARMLWTLSPTLPVVFMTGHSDKELLPPAVAERASLLRKPFDASTLMDALTKARDRDLS